MEYKAPKGMKDILPSESYKWQYIESVIREAAAKYGFQEARTPILEHTELFLRGVGNTTDIVQKEMYTFTDKGDRSVTLKPEGTAGIARLYLENNLYAETQPIKMFYLNSPTFRYEKPQAGRLREHHQFGVEVFGAKTPFADAECILLAVDVLTKLGLTDLSVRVNCIGCPECRPKYQAALHSYLKDNYDQLCATCKTRFETNPLRILDCKVESCQKLLENVPKITDFLCDECKAHFATLLNILDQNSISYEITPKLVRGLDYYTKDVFEIYSKSLPSQGAIFGGGRYDNLIEELSGPATPGVGFGMGMERLINVLEECNLLPKQPNIYDVYIANAGDNTNVTAFSLVNELRKLGIKAGMDVVGRSLKAQFKYADKIRAPYVITIGEDELNQGSANLKDMQSGESIRVTLSANEIASKIRHE